MSIFQVYIVNTEYSFSCGEDQNVLKAMEKLGLDAIPVGCRGGGCGVCRVKVLDGGKYRTGKMSRSEVSVEDEEQGVCLACKLIPESNLQLRILGKFQEAFEKGENAV